MVTLTDLLSGYLTYKGVEYNVFGIKFQFPNGRSSEFNMMLKLVSKRFPSVTYIAKCKYDAETNKIITCELSNAYKIVKDSEDLISERIVLDEDFYEIRNIEEFEKFNNQNIIYKALVYDPWNQQTDTIYIWFHNNKFKGHVSEDYGAKEFIELVKTFSEEKELMDSNFSF